MELIKSDNQITLYNYNGVYNLTWEIKSTYFFLSSIIILIMFRQNSFLIITIILSLL